MYCNAVGTANVDSADATRLNLVEFQSFCHDIRCGHGLIRSVPVARVFRQAVVGFGAAAEGNELVGSSSPKIRRRTSSRKLAANHTARLNNQLFMDRHVRG